MLIVLHVAIALLGLLQATFGLVAPSRRKLMATYAFTTATFVSGTYLVVHLHQPLLQSCLSGLTYLSLIIAATVLAHRRLAQQSKS